ncbi:bifunctional 2-polyprenyl-6-hydroxyphenol methylase/3-demethylubiquinol 3-O-methyltransferase UbiG [Nocardia sp. NRRL S-836]|uniref:class I SAM-dependent methyltransferase n=1 Tax=Nocardia sp. NRRL S-836 TaxID=1519492 RepID=UPI0009EBDA1C|nr:class I SAM-dependent methyltransferase [Nocardia sp. NRRL S-836]
MDLSSLAVPHTLAHLTPLLPPAPARVLEAGCGRGALAAALAELGHDVTGVDRNAEMAAAARERGVDVLHADLLDVSGEYDVVLFTRSLHHAEDLDALLTHAVTLLAPGGRLVVEEFGWERVDQAAAEFVLDSGALLRAAGVLDTETPATDLLGAWVERHEHLHRGSAMLAALGRFGALTTVDTPMLWRMVDGRGGRWRDADRAPDVLAALRAGEERRLAAGTLPHVGIAASALIST